MNQLHSLFAVKRAVLTGHLRIAGRIFGAIVAPWAVPSRICAGVGDNLRTWTRGQRLGWIGVNDELPT
jgi:hypothetical protein